MTSSSVETRTTEDYIGEIVAMLGGGASRDEVTQRLRAEGMPEERAKWLFKQARRASRRAGLEPLTRISAILFVVSFAAGFGLLFNGYRLAAGIAMIMSIASMLFSVGGALAIEMPRAIDWDPRGLVPAFYATNPPRNVRRSKRSRQSWRAAVFAVMFFCLISISIGVVELSPLIVLRQRGVETTGTIVRRRKSQTSRSTHYRVEYRFEAQHGVWIPTVETSKEIYDRSKPGTLTPVVYDPANPGRSRPMKREDLTWMSIGGDAGIPVFLGIAVIAFLPYIGKVQRRRIDSQLRLARDGTIAVATVEEVTNIAIGYRFDGGTGSWRLGRKQFSFKPRPGDRIAVLHDPAQPGVSETIYGLADVEQVS